jgi:tetratricopeptide (TPR) repeat protein
MLKITPIIFGLLISFSSSTMAKASNTSIKPDKNLGVNLLVQFGTTPTYNQRQQEAFHRDTSNYLIQLENEKRLRQQAENERKIRRLALDFTNRKDYFGLGKLFYNNGYMRDAIEAYSKAIEINPRDYLSYYLRAEAKSVQEDLRGAFADYDMAIAINPEYGSIYIDRGIEKFKSKDKNGALQDFRSAARIYKKQGDAENLKAVIRKIQYLFKVPE